MKFKKLLKSRKTVRTYTGKAADKKDLQKILEAGEYAPAAMGKYENYLFTVVTDKKLLKAIDQEAAMMFGDLHSHPLYGVPTLILVSAKKVDEMAWATAGIMGHNMVLAAEDKGYGACYIYGAVAALRNHPETIADLDLPDGFTPLCGVGVGETEEELEKRVIDKERVGITEAE